MDQLERRLRQRPAPPSRLRKLLIVPWFGALPAWMPLFERNVARLERYGYDVLLDRDEEAFRARVRAVLGVECAELAGTRVSSGFRPAFGLLYRDEIGDRDFWGHTDLDVVFGRVEWWVTDDFLSRIDVHSNDLRAVAGLWTLYRNTRAVNELVLAAPDALRSLGTLSGIEWVERGFSDFMRTQRLHRRVRYVNTYWQADQRNLDRLIIGPQGRLLEEGREVMMAHFKTSKRWPPGCRLAG